MTIDARPAPMTALSILETDGPKIEPLLKEARFDDPQRDDGVVSAASWTTLLPQVCEAVAGLLDIDIARVLIAGWRKYEEVIEAARVTRGTTKSKPVDLGGRTLSLRQHPRVDVKWGERTVASVPFEVVLQVQVHAVTGTVRGGSLVSISSGRCVVDVSVETKGLKRGTRDYEFDPLLVVDLGDGIRLVE